ncbi:MAG: PAS domain-containing sensor histidine kinase [Dehalogenimonas sp.]
MNKSSKNTQQLDGQARVLPKGGSKIRAIRKHQNLSHLYKLYFNSSSDALVVTWWPTINSEIVIYEVNKSACKILGYSREELIGKKIIELHPLEDRDKLYSSVGPKLLKGHVVFEATHLTKTGNRIPVEINAHRFNSDGLQLCLSVVRDISLRKQTEDTLQQLLEREHFLCEELQESNNHRIEFTRALVHELKTPLTPLLGASAALIDKVQNEPVISLARCIKKGSEALNRRIQELLDFNKGELGLLKLQCVSVDPRQLIYEVCDYIKPLAESKKINIQTNIADDLPKIRADEGKINQILLNLLDNSIRFTPTGGSVTILVNILEGQVVFTITDTGIGMTKNKMRSLFSKHQYSVLDRENQSGMQIGLTLCKMLVELHGGSLDVFSKFGKGTRVTFCIPIRIGC